MVGGHAKTAFLHAAISAAAHHAAATQAWLEKDKPPSRYPSASWDLGPDPFCVLGPGIVAFFELGPGPRFFENLGFLKMSDF